MFENRQQAGRAKAAYKQESVGKSDIRAQTTRRLWPLRLTNQRSEGLTPPRITSVCERGTEWSADMILIEDFGSAVHMGRD